MQRTPGFIICTPGAVQIFWENVYRVLRVQLVCENKEEEDPTFVALEAIILHICDPEKNPVFQCKTEMTKRVEELVIKTEKCNMGISSDYSAIAQNLFGAVWMETRLAETKKEIKEELKEFIKKEFAELKKEIKKLVEKRHNPSDEEGEEETIDKKIRQDK